MVTLSTLSDQQRGWRIIDPVVRLRALETGELYPLPDPALRGDAVLGSGGASALQLHDPSGRVSHRHARLAWDGQRWALRDLESKNGLWSDGVRRRSVELVPGVEVRLGGLTLLAESAALLRLRALVARLIGWSDDHRREVDRALRGLRDAALLRASLVLCGAGDLVPIAHRLHRETLGPDRPFLACGPGDRAGALLRCARDGTLCASAREPPEDLTEAIDTALTTACAARLTLHAPDALAASPLGLHLGATVWLELPPLYRRRAASRSRRSAKGTPSSSPPHRSRASPISTTRPAASSRSARSAPRPGPRGSASRTARCRGGPAGAACRRERREVDPLGAAPSSQGRSALRQAQSGRGFSVRARAQPQTRSVSGLSS
jgi:hypothetical protein